MDYGMRNLIEKLTTDVISIFQIHYPIDNIYEIVERIGGEVFEDEGLSEYSDGFIQRMGDRFKIVVSQQQPRNRKNFTIAHELGHLFLHMGYLIDDELWNKQGNLTYYRSGNSEQEYQANEFAAALLMPREQYVRIMNQNSDGNTVYIDKVAEYFNVSINAASNRGKWLGYLEW